MLVTSLFLLVLSSGMVQGQVDYGNSYNACADTEEYVKYVASNIKNIKKASTTNFPEYLLKAHIYYSIDGVQYAGDYYTSNYKYYMSKDAPMDKYLIIRDRLIGKDNKPIDTPHAKWDLTSPSVVDGINSYQCLQNKTYVVMMIMHDTTLK